jgi:transcriptional antiterminator RfaH
MTAGMRWYVVQTQSRAEAKAAAHLCRQGFDIYLPRYLKRRRHARRIETVAAPLFPRYMFVAVDIAVQRWRTIHSTIGVSRLVCNGDNPVAVADDGLKCREDERGFVKLARRPRFAPGARIRVVNGVFSDCLGLFESTSDGERVAILLDLLGRKVRVSLDSEFVMAA